MPKMSDESKKKLANAAGGAVTAGVSAAKAGGSGKEIVQAAVGGTGIPSFGGARDRIVGAAYDATARGVKKVVPAMQGAVQNVVGRTQHFLEGLGRKDNA